MNCKNGKDGVRDKQTITNFVKELVPAIGMEAHGEPQIEHFGVGNKAGYTLVQLITTSNICGHFCDESGDFYLDVFSCKEFQVVTVRNLVIKYFSPAKNKELLLKRGV